MNRFLTFTSARSGFLLALAAALLLGACGRNDGLDFDELADAPTVRAQTDDGPVVTLAMVGDLLPHDMRRPLKGVASHLRGADITFGNLEEPLTRRGQPTPLKFENGRLMHNEFIFRADPAYARDLRGAGFDVVSLANNHMMDHGVAGLRDTWDALDRAGIAHAGAAPQRSDIWPPAVVEREGLRVAFLAYVSARTLPGTEHFAAEADRPGVAFIHKQGEVPAAATRRQLRRDIAAAREQADIVVASFHWGHERETEPSTFQRQVAHRAVDYGADVVVGHHPHVLQGIEVYEGKPIFYSLGNFVFPSYDADTRRTGVAWVKLTPAGPRSVVFRGAWIDPASDLGGEPEFGRDTRAQQTAAVVVRQARDLGARADIATWRGEPVARVYLDSPPVPAAAPVPPRAAPAAVKPVAERSKPVPGAPGDLVEVTEIVPDAVVDMPYATTDNVFEKRLYDANRAFLRRTTAEKLQAAQAELAESGLRLKIWDAYRPLPVQREMWEQVRDASYVAPPNPGSHHNRGAAVDVTLVDSDGNELPMPTGYDHFGPEAHVDYAGAGETERRHRWLLRRAMLNAGFRPLSTEWWHYVDPDATRYPVEDFLLSELAARVDGDRA